jgi:dimethylsulfoniopropionate demethylase
VLEQGAKSFTVYNHMLLATQFESLEADYWHLCSAVQVWDVSAERQISISGPDANELLQWMTPRNIADVACDRCVYLPLADEDGKLINDPVGIRLADDHWWLSIADSDVLLWAKGLARGAKLSVRIEEADVWPLAVQGPLAEELMSRVFGDQVKDIRFFRYARLSYSGAEFIVARSGWSKQGGFEIYVDDIAIGRQLYEALFAAGRDLDVRAGCPNLIERLEGGLLSYGNDMDIRHSVLEAGLGSFISIDDDIDALAIDALRQERDNGIKRRVVGLLVEAEHGPKPLAEQPFIDLSFDQAAEYIPDDYEEAIELPDALVLQKDSGPSLGSQAYSPRYGVQLATAMLLEPQASETHCFVQLADKTIVEAKVCSLPFNFEQLGIPSRV